MIRRLLLALALSSDEIFLLARGVPRAQMKGTRLALNPLQVLYVDVYCAHLRQPRVGRYPYGPDDPDDWLLLCELL